MDDGFCRVWRVWSVETERLTVLLGVDGCGVGGGDHVAGFEGDVEHAIMDCLEVVV